MGNALKTLMHIAFQGASRTCRRLQVGVENRGKNRHLDRKSRRLSRMNVSAERNDYHIDK
ncbi:hypothetical protein RCWATERBOI_1 [Rhodobacter phage RcWaterboi]|nr:hypothetical protein RCWATERBOI_1 [Rhodobacter phage RcWaterboi]